MAQTRKLPTISDGDLARWLGRQGRGGDTIVAHINPQEAMMLRMMGGAGTHNPKTGLLEFLGVGTKSGSADRGTGSGSQGGSADRGGEGPGSGDKGVGISGGQRGPSDRIGGDLGGGRGNRDSNAGVARSGVSGYGARNASTGAVQGNAPLNEQIAQAMAAYNNALSNYNDPSFGQTLSRIAAGLIGFNKIDPTTQGIGNFDPRQNSSAGQSVLGGGPQAAHADWGFDPVGVVAGTLGMGFGVPGMGLVADQVSGLLGRPAEINMGQSVFGGSPSSPGAPSAAGSPAAGQVAQGAGPGSTLMAAIRANQAKAAQPASPAPATTLAPVGAPQPAAMPQGLLAYLALINAMLPGYQTNSRFGQGSVAPVTVMRPYA